MLLAAENARDRLAVALAHLARTLGIGAPVAVAAAALAALGGDGRCLALAGLTVAPVAVLAADDGVRVVVAAVRLRRVRRRAAAGR